jgi:hypothetical protein
MRLTSGAEVVINAIPFGSADAAQIQTFAEQVDRDFLPRPQGAQSCISIATPDPARDAPVAFAAFRAILKSTGVNLASFCFAAGADADALAPFHDAAVWAIVWAAIRAGWREGYGLEAVVAAKEDAQATHAFTKFSAAGGSAEELHAHIVKVKAGQASWKNFDFEVAFPETRTPTTPEELTARVQAIKDRGIAVQSVAPWLELSDPGARKHIAALAEAARHVGVTLSFRSRGEERSSGQENYALLEEIGRLTGGRFHFRYFTKEALDAGRLRTLASRLLGKSIPT